MPPEATHHDHSRADAGHGTQAPDPAARATEAPDLPAPAGPDPIAIVGIGLKYPGGSESPAEFDDFLREGRSGISPLPEDRWDVAAFTPQEPGEKGKIQTTGGGFLDRIDLFDASFFNISPKEAQYIDPQQRLVLETAWQALEHANIDPAPLRRGNGGVYIGVSSIDYALELDSLPYEELDGHLASGITMFPMSGRLSYFLGWRGPSMSIDTACSSSLAAMHSAVQGLRNGECDIALAGGVNALHHPRITVMFSHANMLAPDGQCKTFDENADGYVRAEGCGIVVLKRLSDAIRDGNEVLALVTGTAVGQDGDSAGLTVPNGPAQEIVIRNALAAAGRTPGDIQYVEAHGTGTPLGDPIELGAINEVFTGSHTKEDPLVVGSVKTNLGHMEPASGMVGVIKSVLQMRSGTIYPHLNFHTPSGRIPWDLYPIEIPTECRPWEAEQRRAVVNSFGFAGTIAAVVLEEATGAAVDPWKPAAGAGAEEPRALRVKSGESGDGGAPAPKMFTLSAKSAPALRQLAERYRAFLDDTPGLDDDAVLDQVCYTANLGRSHFPYRLAGPVCGLPSLRKLIDGALADQDQDPTGLAAAPTAPGPSGIRKTCFMFSGQGSQYAGMGAALYQRFGVFRETVDRCDALFAEPLGRSVRDMLLGTGDDPAAIDRTSNTQPALFTLEYALAQLWLSWGVKPNVLIGHSIGEVTAAAVAGLFSLPDAVTLVAARARLMQSVRAPGGMAAVAAPAESVAPLLEGRADLALAAINAPDQCVISGAHQALDEVIGKLTGDGVRVDRLGVSHAFHSPLMAEVFEDFRAVVAGIEFQEPSLTLVSNVTGKVARLRDLSDPDYWVRHIGRPVRFMEGIRAVAKRGRHAMVEIGPSTALTALARRSLNADDHVWLASLSRRDRDGDTTLRALASYYTAGLSVSWSGFHGDHDPGFLQLPTYAFHRRPYWLPKTGAKRTRQTGGPAVHPLLGRERGTTEETEDTSVREFTAEFDAGQLPALADHRDAQGAVLPAAAWAELLLAAQDAVEGSTAETVRDLRIEAPLRLPEDDTVTLITKVAPAGSPEGPLTVEIASDTDGVRTVHATALLSAVADGPEPAAVTRLRELAGAPGEILETADGIDLHTDASSTGRRFGPAFRTLTRVSRHPGGVVTARLANPRTASAVSAVEQLPAEILESALLALVALDDDGPVYRPRSIDRFRLHRKPRGGELDLTAIVRPLAPGDAPGDQSRRADLLLSSDGRPVAELLGVTLARPAGTEAGGRFLHRPVWLRDSRPGPERAARHIVVAHGADELPAAVADLADRAAQQGVRLTLTGAPGTLAAALADPSATDAVWFWRAAPGEFSADRMRQECEENYRSLLAALAALTEAGNGPAPAPRLWLVTERGQWLPGDLPGTGEQPAATTLWGFGHVLLTEDPLLKTTLVDLDGEDAAEALLGEIRTAPEDEFQIAYRHGRRHVQRLLAGGGTPPWEGGFEIRGGDAPLADTEALAPVPAADGTPVGDEVQVLVSAVGLTAHDAAEAEPPRADETPAPSETPALSEDAEPGGDAEPESAVADAVRPVIGGSCSGVVTAVGPDAALRIGDLVTVAHPGTLRRTVTVPSAAATAYDPDGDALSAAARAARGTAPAAGQDTGSGLDLYTLDEVAEALRAAAAGAPHGPVVVQVGPAVSPRSADEANAPRTAAIRSDRAYLVTGGLGGLGLATAGHLADLGARHLVLVSRSGRATPEAAALLQELGKRAEVRIERADLGDAADVARLTTDLRESPQPLGGIVHAAGALGKSLISAMSWPDIEEQLSPKAYGAWLLHEASADFPELEFFVGYSSIASLLGGATQGHYAAASAFLDGLATQRTRSGLPGLAVNWGAWSRVGMSARLEESLAEEIERSGVRFFSPGRALRALSGLWGRGVDRRMAGDVDWETYTSQGALSEAVYARLVRGSGDGSGDGPQQVNLRGLPPAERRAAVSRLVSTGVAAVLQLDDVEQLDVTAEFVSLGLDSLMAMTVKSGLESALRMPLPASLTFDHPTAQRLTEYLDSRLEAS
ncbi:SDR family NAD(P)-dependent oxidoreductase [Streptomyces jumonjinensis]|uniref:SDR family NAD(P)-dependent oxidoreductase n=1 Tax=Streptomyces jumonjinensis TaxID=1945 RepID=UPI003798E146